MRLPEGPRPLGQRTRGGRYCPILSLPRPPRGRRVGVSTSVPLPAAGQTSATVGGTGCCGFLGPIPSATLDKILTQLKGTIRTGGRRGNCFFREFGIGGDLRERI